MSLAPIVQPSQVHSRARQKTSLTSVVQPPKGLPKRITNSIGMKFVLIPAGSFLMGSPPDEEGRKDDEGPQHEVEITQPFYLAVTPVTQKQYETVMGTNPSYFSAKGRGKYKVSSIDDTRNYKVSSMDTRQFPVEKVSWEDAIEFCNWLAALTKETESGHSYRLPTEAEWEYACRGGAASSQVFHFGNSLSSRQANFDVKRPPDAAGNYRTLARTCKVGSHPPNRFGLCDMHGNVCEWCQDWYDKNYYATSPRQDPKGPLRGSARVFRGGCWRSSAEHCRSAYRDCTAAGARNPSRGFRVVLVLARQAAQAPFVTTENDAQQSETRRTS